MPQPRYPVWLAEGDVCMLRRGFQELAKLPKPLSKCQVRGALAPLMTEWATCGDTERHELRLVPKSYVQLLWLLGACRDVSGQPILGPDGNLMCPAAAPAASPTPSTSSSAQTPDAPQPKRSLTGLGFRQRVRAFAGAQPGQRRAAASEAGRTAAQAALEAQHQKLQGKVETQQKAHQAHEAVIGTIEKQLPDYQARADAANPQAVRKAQGWWAARRHQGLQDEHTKLTQQKEQFQKDKSQAADKKQQLSQKQLSLLSAFVKQHGADVVKREYAQQGRGLKAAKDYASKLASQRAKAALEAAKQTEARAVQEATEAKKREIKQAEDDEAAATKNAAELFKRSSEDLTAAKGKLLQEAEAETPTSPAEAQEQVQKIGKEAHQRLSAVVDSYGRAVHGLQASEPGSEKKSR